MFVDRRKDNYDELQILAGDVRTRRTRANFWTTSLVVGAMIATAAYVATTNNQVEDLKTDKTAAEQERDLLRPLVIRLTNERDALKAERDIYKQLSAWNADTSPTKYLGDNINNLAEALKRGPSGAAVGPVFPDVVWLVDGSRRFPMAKGDFLWIPETTMWIKLDDLADDGTVRVYRERDAMGRPEGEDPGQEEKLPLQIPNSVRGGTNHVCLKLYKPSNRPGFQGEFYVDIEVLFQPGPCPPSTPPYKEPR